MSKSKKTIILCVICGVVAAACVFIYTQSVKANAENARLEAMSKYGGEQIEVCVANRDIAAGETINSSSFDVKM